MKTKIFLDLRSALVLTKSELRQLKGGNGAFLCKCTPLGQEYSVGGDHRQVIGYSGVAAITLERDCCEAGRI